MGNVDSSNAFAGVDELKETLSGLESRLASIEAGHRHVLQVAELDASTEYVGNGLLPSDASSGGGGLAVAGAMLACDQAVKVLVGPVVGLVTGDTARILLEVDHVAEVTAHACLVDESCPGGRQVATVQLAFPARQPLCFQLTRLLPGERYIVCFSGLCRHDALNCMADFRTVDLISHEVRFLAVSGDRPDALGPGEFNLWETVAERVQSAQLSPVTCVLHAGGNVYLKQAFEECWVLFKRTAVLAERGPLEPGYWLQLCTTCLETLRNAYRFTWNLPCTKACLAVVPHLMLGSDADVYPCFTTCAELSAECGGLAAGTVLRLARRVYWEYQRQLWDPNALAMAAADAAASETTFAVLDARLVRVSRENAVANAESAVMELRSAKVAAPLLAKAEQVLQSRQSDLMEATASEQNAIKQDVKAAQKVSTDGVSSLLESTIVMVTGHAAVLLVDTNFSALGADGSPLPAADAACQVFLPESFWALLDSTLDQDSPVRTLTVLSTSPIADGSRSATAAVLAAGGPFAPENSRWSARESDQEKLLARLFDWKAKEPYRELLFVSGAVSGGCGSTSLVRDDGWPANGVQGGGRARQLVTGPLTNQVGAWPFTPLAGSLGLSSRFAVKHKPLRGQRSYAEALFKVPAPKMKGSTSRRRGSTAGAGAGGGDVGTPEGGDDKEAEAPSLYTARVAAARVIGHYFEEVNLVVGPVIGVVTHHAALVLVEVDAAAPVSAVLVNSLTGSERRILKRLPGGKPYVFQFDGLEPERHYSVRFEGVENAASRLGGFTTLRKWSVASGDSGEDPKLFKFNAIAVHGDEPYEGLDHSSSSRRGSTNTSPGFGVWSSLRRESERPIGAPDVVLHLGGQVSMSAALSLASTCLARASAEPSGSAEQRRLEAAAEDALRGAYRAHWNLPGVREALAQGGRLMLRGASDIGELLLGPSRSATSSSASGSASSGGAREGSDASSSGSGGSKASSGGSETVVAGADRRKLCALVERVYRDYQRALWDPTLGQGGPPLFGCSAIASSSTDRGGGGGQDHAGSGGGHGEWHYHLFGRLGVFVMDLKEQRLWGSGAAGAPPQEVPLVTAAQWRSLNSVLASAKQSGLAHLVVCSEVPFVDDSAEDAALKASSTEHAHLANHWPCHGSELRKLLHALFGWRAEEPNREVTLVCGGAGYSLQSMLRHLTRGEILQVVCGPLSTSTDMFWSEPRGELDDSLSYAHGVPSSTRGLKLLEFNCATPDAIECLDTLISENDCETGGASASVPIPPVANDAGAGGALVASDGSSSSGSKSAWPPRPPCLVAALERPQWLELATARCATNPPPVALQPRLQELGQLLKQPDVQATLGQQVFNAALLGGAHAACADPGGLACLAAPPLLMWFYRDAPDSLRSVCAGPPSAYTLEAVARRWHDPKSSSSSGGSKSKNNSSRGFGSGLDPTKPLANGPTTKLALLTAAAFTGLVTEALALGVLLAEVLNTGGARED